MKWDLALIFTIIGAVVAVLKALYRGIKTLKEIQEFFLSLEQKLDVMAKSNIEFSHVMERLINVLAERKKSDAG
jgi:type I restriction-modification system DNA methylase subunit